MRNPIVHAVVLLLVLGPWSVRRSPAEARVERDQTYGQAGGEKLLVDIFMPDDSGDGVKHPAVLVVHGGGWKAGTKGQLAPYARALAKRGYVAFAISYRLAPKHKFPAQLEDCRTALRWMRANADRYAVDPGRVGAIGYSAGGHLVAMLGCQSHPPSSTSPADDTTVQAVVAGGAPCDFRFLGPDNDQLGYWLGGTYRERPQVYEDASPATYVSTGDPPILFYHGAEDELVPLASPRAMVELLRKANVETDIIVIDGARHIPAALNVKALERAIEFLDQHLKSKPAGEPASD